MVGQGEGRVLSARALEARLCRRVEVEDDVRRRQVAQEGGTEFIQRGRLGSREAAVGDVEVDEEQSARDAAVEHGAARVGRDGAQRGNVLAVVLGEQFGMARRRVPREGLVLLEGGAERTDEGGLAGGGSAEHADDVGGWEGHMWRWCEGRWKEARELMAKCNSCAEAGREEVENFILRSAWNGSRLRLVQKHFKTNLAGAAALARFVSVQPFHREGCIIKKTHCNTSPLLQLPGSKMPPPGPPTRLEEVPEPDALLRAYQAALAGDATIPPVEPLRALLFDAAEKGAPLSSLSLRGVPVGRHGARALANVLYLDSFITFANLEDCSLGDDGAIAVAESLRTHPTLFRLDLGYNGVSGKGVKAIAQLLLESPSLLCLDLSGNNLYSRLNLVAPSALSNRAA